MTGRTTSLGLAALVVAFAACTGGSYEGAEAISTTSPIESTTTTSSSVTTTTVERELIITGDLTVIVPPGRDGDYYPDQMVACSQFQFPFGALEDIAPLTPEDPPGVWSAIRGFLGSDEGEFWPQEDWYVVLETPRSIELVALSDDGQMAHMTVSPGEPEGTWTWSGASLGEPCTIEYATPPALGRVDWRIDPSADPLTADSETIDVLVVERGCASGQAMGDRLIGPQVVMTPGEVRIAFAARPLGGAQNCPSNPETAVTVQLPIPLGSREVIVGQSMGIELSDYLD